MVYYNDSNVKHEQKKWVILMELVRHWKNQVHDVGLVVLTLKNIWLKYLRKILYSGPWKVIQFC